MGRVQTALPSDLNEIKENIMAIINELKDDIVREYGWLKRDDVCDEVKNRIIELGIPSIRRQLVLAVKQLHPKPGMGATFTLWSDSHAGTISRVSESGRTLWWKQDKATLLNGMNSGEPDELVAHPGGFCAHVEGIQRWSYEQNESSPEQKFTLRQRRNGEYVWKRVGSATNSPGGTLTVGVRAEHYDYNF